MLKSALLIAVHVAVCVAHVRLINDGTVTYAIRNANSPTGNGAMSVAGPCGGQNTFGRNGMTTVVRGSEMTLKINYNGGHRSPNNEFHAVWHCTETGPTQTEMKEIVDDTTENGLNDQKTLTLKTGTTPAPKTDKPNYIDASTGNQVTNGYVHVFDLPQEAVGMCTVSIVDQRDWGGCVDLMVEMPPAPGTPPTPPSPTPAPTSPVVVEELVGTYVSAPQYDSCLSNFPTCCCMSTSTDVYKNKRNGNFEMTVTYSVDSTWSFNMSNNCIIQNGTARGEVMVASQPNTFYMMGEVGMGGAQPFTFQLKRNRIDLTNTALDVPRFCDGQSYLLTPQVTMIKNLRDNYTAELKLGEVLAQQAATSPTLNNTEALKAQIARVNQSYTLLQSAVAGSNETNAKKFAGNSTAMAQQFSNFTIAATGVADGNTITGSGSQSSASSTAGIVVGVFVLLLLVVLLIVFRNRIAAKLGADTSSPAKYVPSVVMDEEVLVSAAATTPKVGPPKRPAPRLANNSNYNPVEPESSDNSYKDVAPNPPVVAARPIPTSRNRPTPPPRPIVA